MVAKKNQTIITGNTTLVPVTELKGYDKNPRKGNVKAIAESLEINKQYRPIVVQESTKKILAGNHTWLAAKSLGWKEIAVVYVDVNDEEAKRIVLADNRTNDLADYDGQILAELLRDLGTSDGTGYSASDMEAILNATMEDLDAVIGLSNDAGERTLSENDPFTSVDGQLGTSVRQTDSDSIDFEEDEDNSDIEDEPDDLSGVYTLKDDMIFQGAKPWDIPLLREDMLIEELPEPLHTWAGSATRDLDWQGYWLYNWGIDSTSGMKDLSKILMSFYCWDEYFEGWWDNSSRHMTKLITAKIKYAITPNYSQGDLPRCLSLYNLYRSRWVGRYMQEVGVRVMPDIEAIFGVRNDKEYLSIVTKSLPKHLPWASLQVQNLTSQTRNMEKETPEFRQEWVDDMKAIFNLVKIDNLLVYAHPKRFSEIEQWFNYAGAPKIKCIETRLFYLSQKVRKNKDEKDRL